MADEALDQFHQIDLEAHRMRQASGGEGIVGLAACTGAARKVDQRLVLQFGQWQPLVAGQTVRRRQHRHQVFFLQHLVADPIQPRQRRQSDQCHVQLSRLHLRDQVLALVDPQLELHLRVRLLEGRQHRHHIDVGQRGDLPDRQQATHLASDGGHVGAQVAQAGQHLACMHQQRLAGGGGPHLARQALEQRCAQFLLKMGDLVTERGLHHVAALGGAGEVALLGQGDGELELLEIHATISFSDDRDDDDSFPS